METAKRPTGRVFNIGGGWPPIVEVEPIPSQSPPDRATEAQAPKADRFSLWLGGACYERAPTVANLWHRIDVYLAQAGGAQGRFLASKLRREGEVRDAGE